MFFLQMNRSFGQLVELVRVCLGRMVVFVGFMVIWIFYFAFSYYVLGSEIDPGADFSVVASECLNQTTPEAIKACKEVRGKLGAVGNEYSDLMGGGGAGRLAAYVILAWRNSIGDLTTPSYPAWGSIEKLPGRSPAVNAIIALIWFHWLATQLLVLIILFNFLIAIVALAFDEVIDTEKKLIYEQRARLNLEYRFTR